MGSASFVLSDGASSLRYNAFERADGMGMRNAYFAYRPLDRATAHKSWEAPIRTLSVSLVAVAAIAASLLLTRSREESDTFSIVPAGENVPARLKLDAIREAGL
jgi:hypothetical protein